MTVVTKSKKVFQLTYTLAIRFPAMLSSSGFILAMYIKVKKIRKEDAERAGIDKNRLA